MNPPSADDIRLNDSVLETLRKEVESSSPPVSQLQTILALEAEFVGNDTYLQKVRSLAAAGEYKGVRLVRRDGSCFYRAFLFGFLESLTLPSGQAVHAHANGSHYYMTNWLPKQRQLIVDGGYDPSILEDFYDEFLDALKLMSESASPLADLERLFDDTKSPGVSNALITFARLVVGAHIRLNAKDYLPFADGYSSIEEYCKREVDPMWVEAEELQVQALCAACGVAVEILYLDRTTASDLPTRHVIPSFESAAVLSLLYRPGHYDLVYASQPN